LERRTTKICSVLSHTGSTGTRAEAINSKYGHA
jgi:hypothetical protein